MAAKRKEFYTVKDVCEEFSITRKTLFYYDRAGLLPPTARVGSQRHKVYDSKATDVLDKTLTFRGAGLSIEEIRFINSCDDSTNRSDLLDHLEKVRKRLIAEKENKEREIANISLLIERYASSK